MLRLGLRSKLILTFIFLAVCPVLIVTFISSHKTISSMKQDAQVKTARLAKGLTKTVSLYLEQQKHIASNLAMNFRSFGGMDIRFYGGPSIDTLTENRINDLFRKILHQFDGTYEFLYLGDADGILFAGVSQNEEQSFKGIDISESNYFLNAKEKISVSNIIQEELIQTPVIIFCAPIQDKRGNFAGVLGMGLRLDTISQLVTSTNIGKTGYAFMIDNTGLIIGHPDKTHVLKLNIKEIPGMKKINALMTGGKSGVEYCVFQGTEKIAAFEPLPTMNWSISVTQNMDELMELGNNIRYSNIIIAIVITILVGSSGFFVSNRIVKPITVTVSKFHNIYMAAEVKRK